VSRLSFPGVQQIRLEPLHPGQARAYRALVGHRFVALRCGRRFGKTALAKSWVAHGLLQGEEVGWFAPEHKHMAEVCADLKATLASLLVASAKTPPALRLLTGGRVDFWSLENPISARGRRYHRVVIDEAAFAKEGDVNSDDSMMAIWEKAIKPTPLRLWRQGARLLELRRQKPRQLLLQPVQRSSIWLRRIPCEDHGQSDPSQARGRRSGEDLARA
jgi:hypothetical protein